MDPIYYFIIGLILVLSCFDLVVGVSNDAANFLNSAVGSKAAPRRTIVLVAALGIIIGSLFSSGMMEIARSGVFMPARFSFHDIMLIFLAVMLTDVILLDVFNTFGLPTSTTVSIVFELLGGAVAAALFKIWSGEPGVAQELSSYINSSKALAIISGIFSSVFIAFICGITVMWISRLIFSFNYQKSFKYLGAVWCGVALTAITYFAIFKGLKGSTLVTKDMIRHLDAHIWLYVCCSLAFWTVLMAVLQNLCKVNILKVSVLAGTMALALSFAGNDLVNFIGVFMAGQSSMEIAAAAAAQGADLTTLSMGGLMAPVTADWRYLLGAGVIMVLALMFSKKAQTVTDTEVNLARQGGGVERFGSVPPARMAVRYALNASRAVEKIMPSCVGRFIEKRFRPVPEGPDNGASFDLIRASVNFDGGCPADFSGHVPSASPFHHVCDVHGGDGFLPGGQGLGAGQCRVSHHRSDYGDFRVVLYGLCRVFHVLHCGGLHPLWRSLRHHRHVFSGGFPAPEKFQAPSQKNPGCSSGAGRQLPGPGCRRTLQ